MAERPFDPLHLLCVYPGLTDENTTRLILLRRFATLTRFRTATRQLALAMALASLAPAAFAQRAAYATPDAPLLGAAWYPEQWPESRWQRDVTLMEQAHFNVVRIGEFAWSTMEPAEGHYDFAWLDRAIELAAQHHIAVVLGTPTDAPPAWLTQKYPGTLRFDASGKRDEHGMRRQFSYASPLYRRFCARIVAEMARRYGHNPNVIGWQIGNEYTDESFDPATRAMFQQFLRDRYKTLDNLNAHWTTAYWSQSYSDWSQIPLESTRGNPGLLLEHKHFVTATWRSFQRNQIDALRPLIDAHQFITTNIGGLAWSDNWDHYAISEDLDLASWDDYVGSGHLDATKNAMFDDFARGWKRENFWIMETQPGFVNWSPLNNALDPGETSAVAWQGIGHGADAILYWQWAPALNGQEQYHGSLVGPDGEPLPLYPEIAKLGANFARVRSALADTHPQAEIALLHTYDSRWAIDFQPHSQLYDQQKVLLEFYAPLEDWASAHGEAIDIIDPTRGPLEQYNVLVAPSLSVIDAPLAKKLTAWVRAGGHLILGPRAGMKDSFDALNPQEQPGPLRDLLGAKIDQFYTLDHELGLARTSTSEGMGHTAIWAEALHPLAADATATLNYIDPGGPLNHQPAMLERKVGAGTIAYLGTLPDEAVLSEILQRPLEASSAKDLIAGVWPSTMEVDTRIRDGDPVHRLVIVINHSAKPSDVTLHGRYRDLLTQATLTPTVDDTALHLPAQGVAVLLPEAP